MALEHLDAPVSLPRIADPNNPITRRAGKEASVWTVLHAAHLGCMPYDRLQTVPSLDIPYPDVPVLAPACDDETRAAPCGTEGARHDIPCVTLQLMLEGELPARHIEARAHVPDLR